MLALYILLAVFGLAIIIYLSIATYVIRRLMFPAKRDNATLVKYEVDEKKYDLAWLDIPFTAMYMDSQFGYKLFGRLYTNEIKTDKFMLVLHGHNSSSISQLKYLQLFLDLGYNVFMPDHRRSGLSQGKSVTFGAYEKHDVIAWINMLEKEYPQADFAIFGESMGAATAIMVASMDKRIRLLIEYCGYANFENLVADYLNNDYLFKFIMPGLKIMAKLLTNTNLKDTNAYNAMKKIDIPTLIIHSKSDNVVMFSNAELLMSANPNAKTVIFEDTVHARSIATYPEEYKQAVKDFVVKLNNN